MMERKYQEIESIRTKLDEQIHYLIDNRQNILDSIHRTAEEKYNEINQTGSEVDSCLIVIAT